MIDLERFTFAQMIEVGSVLRKLGRGASSLDEVANKIVRYLYDHLGCQGSNQRACLLVRLFKTASYGDLNQSLRQSADAMLKDVTACPTIKCLTLLATAGDRPEWNTIAESVGHKAIPLPTEKAVENIPMISRLFYKLGLNSAHLLKPEPSFLVETGRTDFNVCARRQRQSVCPSSGGIRCSLWSEVGAGIRGPSS